MVFKPFSRLASQGFAKTLAHGYAPSVVAASQSSYASTTTSFTQFHNYPAHKLSRTSQLQHVFQGAPNNNGSGAKAGYIAQGTSTNGDGGLALYYAAWQHAQQTGDDSDWRQHQFARRIGWKSPNKTRNVRHEDRHDSSVVTGDLRPGQATRGRAYSENAIDDVRKAQDAFAEAEALAKIDDAIAQEIKSVKESSAAEATAVTNPDTTRLRHDVDDRFAVLQYSDPFIEESEASSALPEESILQSDASYLTSPTIDESLALSDHIVDLGNRQQYAEIPSVFESMLKQGLTPTVDAYNAILVSAIQLTVTSYQVYPRALEVFSDMVRRSVKPDEATYQVLIPFLAGRAIKAAEAIEALTARSARFGGTRGGFVFSSSEMEHESFAGDSSVDFAAKLYRQARSRFPGSTFPEKVYQTLAEACIKQGRIEDMTLVVSDMKARSLPLASILFAPMIRAYGLTGDLEAANNAYAEYRALAVSRIGSGSDSEDWKDMETYVALINAYKVCGHEDKGLRFYHQVLQSYQNAENGQQRMELMRTVFLLRSSIPNFVVNRAFAEAIETAKSFSLNDLQTSQAMSKICCAAADADDFESAQAAYNLIKSGHVEAAPAAMAMVALNTRHGRLSDARPFWEHISTSSTHQPHLTDLTTMYATALIRSGTAEEGLLQGHNLFAVIRNTAAEPDLRSHVAAEIDEALVMFQETLTKANANVSAKSSVILLRTMIENGGLIPPITRLAIANLGPDCVNTLSFSDIALTLHVQAKILTEQSAVCDDAHLDRFSHLLGTVLNRGMPMDPSTINIVSQALPRLNESRPDLVRRWHEYLRPAPTLAHVSFTIPQTSTSEPPQNETHDPYAYNTDYRASTIIAEQLENTTGRFENHLRDALSRFRNVRRAGRHARYNTYAKLIMAAAKTNQANLINELLGMARTDVPLVPHYPVVKAGWVQILDSMVAASLTVGDRQLAAQYHQDLLDLDAAPSANTFGLYITTLKETAKTFDDATEAVKIFQRAVSEGVEPGVFLYNAVIGKLGKARRIDDCLFYFADMQAKSIRPSSVTYGTLVNALCRTSEERFAEEMFDEMESMPNYRPRAAPYNCIIQYFLNTKRDRNKVLSYFERMKSRSIKPTSHTYKLLIEAHASLEPINLQAAESIFSDIKASGMQPEAVHYGSLIHAKGCVLHDMAGAREIFDSVLANCAIRPNDNLYQNLFEAMVANRQVTETSEVLKDMSARGVTMTPYIANTLIHGWAADGDLAKAHQIYDKLGSEKREPSTYEAMTRAYLSHGDHDGASYVVQEMLRKGYPAAVAEKILILIGSNTA